MIAQQPANRLACFLLILYLHLVSASHLGAEAASLSLERVKDNRVRVTYAAERRTESDSQSESEMVSPEDDQQPMTEDGMSEDDDMESESETDEDKTDCGCEDHLQTLQVTDYVNCVMNEILSSLLDLFSQPMTQDETES